jgi:hypothetical protein
LFVFGGIDRMLPLYFCGAIALIFGASFVIRGGK